jgi:phenylacetate-CoA ligase
MEGIPCLFNEDKSKRSDFNGQIINKVWGRTSDIIELENGHVLTGPGFTILFKDIPVEYYHIKKSGFNTINCTMKKLDNYTNYHEKIILSTFRKQMGDNASLNLEYSDKVKYSKSGKRKYFD